MGLFVGILSHDWQELTSRNKFSLKHWPVKYYYDLKSRSNDKYNSEEKKVFGAAIDSVKLENDPIFILGHWRSGTTMLHNLICKDEQFAYPNLFESYNPHTFLSLYPKIEADKNIAKNTKRPMDNVQVNYKSPAEDEFALSLLSLCSPVLGWAFPKRRDEYDKFLLLDDISEEERERWHKALIYLVKKLTLKYQKTVVLKSPQHTARISKILSVFPNAKFIHFRRNPYDVFKSTLQLYSQTVRSLALQRYQVNGLDDYIIKTYKVLYSQFLHDKNMIPESNLYEISYEEFIADVDTGLANVYAALQLNGVDRLLNSVKRERSKNSKYKRNTYEQLDVSIQKKINSEWEQFFHEWNYQLK